MMTWALNMHLDARTLFDERFNVSRKGAAYYFRERSRVQVMSQRQTAFLPHSISAVSRVFHVDPGR